MMNQRPSSFAAPRPSAPTAYPAKALPQQQRPPAAATPQLPPEHTDIIHDTQFDYYGELLATASSDRTIGIHVARVGHPVQRIACLAGHEGPVWMVSWAHPRFGRVLVSASFDQKAIVWKEVGQRWSPVHVIDIHRGSVNAVCWAPEHVGPVVASASSDGTVAVTAYRDGYWTESVRISNNANNIAHAMGATSVSFAPFRSTLSPDTVLLASGGCDCQVRIWATGGASGAATQEHDTAQSPLSFALYQALEGFGDWVRDVAFSPTSAASRHLVLAACGQDKRVVLFRKEWAQIESELAAGTSAASEWERSPLEFKEPVWRLSWAPSGEMLVVTTASSESFILQEGAEFTEPWVVTPLKDYQQ